VSGWPERHTARKCRSLSSRYAWRAGEVILVTVARLAAGASYSVHAVTHFVKFVDTDADHAAERIILGANYWVRMDVGKEAVNTEEWQMLKDTNHEPAAKPVEEQHTRLGAVLRSVVSTRPLLASTALGSRLQSLVGSNNLTGRPESLTNKHRRVSGRPARPTFTQPPPSAPTIALFLPTLTPVCADHDEQAPREIATPPQ